MASSSSRKRTRSSSDDESSHDVAQSYNPFAADRAATGLRHKRARMTTGLVSPPTEDLEMADDGGLSPAFLGVSGAKRGVSGGWADAAPASISSSRFERTARQVPASSGLSSPPLSPYPTSASALPLSSSRSASGGLASSSKAPAAFPSSNSGPRITLRPSPTLSSLPPSTSLSTVAPDSDSEDEGDDEAEDEDEAYDPEEAQSDIGVSDDEDDGPADKGDSSDDDDDVDDTSRKPGPSVPVPVSGMNAFLHELHLAHRRAKPQTPTRPPPPSSRPSSSAAAAPLVAKETRVQAMDARAIAAARAAAVRREAAQRREESARVLAATSDASPKKSVGEKAEGGESVGAQYEETNRLLGALLLSRRRHLNLPAEEEEQGD